MKIISPYRDYYDSATFTGADYNLHYLRKPTAMKIHNMKALLGNYFWRECKWPPFMDNVYPAYQGWRVGFAGKIFCQGITVKDESYKAAMVQSVEYIDITDTYADKDRIALFERYGPTWYMINASSVEDALVRYKDYRANYSTRLVERYGIDHYIISNGRLENLGFAKVISPAEAYIEMERYLSNLARPDKPIPKMDNDIKIHQHGFDKHSFRSSKRGD